MQNEINDLDSMINELKALLEDFAELTRNSLLATSSLISNTNMIIELRPEIDKDDPCELEQYLNIIKKQISNFKRVLGENDD